MCPGTSCVNHAFRYPLLVKMSHFLQKVEVFKQRGASASCFKCVLIIGYFNSQVACEGLFHAVGAHGIQLPDFSVALSGIFMEPGAEGSALGGVGFGVGLINSGSIVSV